MRFLALALFIVTAVSYCRADDVEELLNLAKLAGAPFTQTALKRMEDNGLWGSKRSNRSCDAVIINASRQTLKLAPQSSCVQGQLSNGLLPENQLNEKHSTVFGMESSKYRQGVYCTIKYESPSGNSWIDMVIDTPFFGDNAVYASSSWDLSIRPVLGAGNHNQVRFVVQDEHPSSMAASTLQGGAPPKKPKGSRNKFVKVSKNGFRHRQA